MRIDVSSVRKEFGVHTALEDIELSIASGSLTSLLGPSGCGKTTLLRIIAGLEKPDGGRVLFDGRDQALVHPRKRMVGFVFQHYALFRHMTVFENVAFGLRVKPKDQRPSEEQIREEVHSMLGMVQLDNQSMKYPNQMSGGQRQRVALARALITKPQLLLLDEPFGALDAAVRKDLRRWLRRLHDEIHITSVLVTHDQEEALEVSDQVVIMNAGRVEQVGSPETIYRSPANSFVYRFLGSVNVFQGRIQEDRLVHYRPDSGDRETLSLEEREHRIYVRPHEFELSKKREYVSDLEGLVVRVGFVGPDVRLEVRGPEIEGSAEYYEVQVPFAEFEAIGIGTGDPVYFRPRTFRTFMGEGI